MLGENVYIKLKSTSLSVFGVMIFLTTSISHCIGTNAIVSIVASGYSTLFEVKASLLLSDCSHLIGLSCFLPATESSVSKYPKEMSVAFG